VTGICVDCVDRVLHIIGESTAVTINDVFIHHGKSPTGTDVTQGGDGGGFWYLGPFTITNTIIADNTSTNTNNNDCRGNPVSLGYNLMGIWDSDHCGFTKLSSDLVGTVSAPLNPGLSALMDNGGPTDTHAVNPGTPPIDQIPNGVNGCTSGSVLDQRDVIRIANCDIGSYEFEYNYIFLPLIMR